VDVRRYPGSRRHPQFSRESLARALAAHGIDYEHAPDLGGRRTPAADSVNGAWRSGSFRGYPDYMQPPGFERPLGELLGGAGDRPTAIMCAEAVPWRCHRQLIADALVARGHDVRNILSLERAEPHRLNPHARVDAHGRVTYPAEGGQRSLFHDRL